MSKVLQIEPSIISSPIKKNVSIVGYLIIHLYRHLEQEYCCRVFCGVECYRTFFPSWTAMDFSSDAISRSKVTESTQCQLDSYGFIAKTIGSGENWKCFCFDIDLGCRNIWPLLRFRTFKINGISCFSPCPE